MAIKLFQGTYQLLNADDTYVLSDASDGFVGTILVHLVTLSAGTTAVTVKARARDIPWADTTPAYLPIPYLSLCAGGTVASYATGATAALAGNDIILIPASGLSVALDVDYTSGSFGCYVQRLIGASA